MAGREVKNGQEMPQGNAQLLTHAIEIERVSDPSPLKVGLISTFIDRAIKISLRSQIHERPNSS